MTGTVQTSVSSYYTGERPSEPLEMSVLDSEGAPFSLVPYSEVTLIGDALPAGVTAVGVAVQGRVTYDFAEAFADAGVLTLQLRMATETGAVDLTAPFNLVVADPADVAALLVTPAEVESWAGVAVSESDIARAQGVVAVACGRDLSNADFISSLSEADYYWLRVSVGYQSVVVSELGDSAPLPFVPGVSSVANGDVRVTYSNVAGSEVSVLGNMAKVAISRLSWMRNFRSIQAKPFSTRGPAPDPWTTISISRGVRY